MSEYELKPCPFCGGMPEWFERGDDGYGERSPDITLACVGTGCLFAPKIRRNTERYDWVKRERVPVDPRAEIVAAWNTRAGGK